MTHRKRLILLGAGNANLQILRRWCDSPIPRTDLTVLNDTAIVPYSGMLPGAIAGRYTSEDFQIDVAALCKKARATFVQARAEHMSHAAQSIETDAAHTLEYDLLSINVGSTTAAPPDAANDPRSISLKPLHMVEARMNALEQRARAHRGRFEIAVIGGGATAFEISLALAHRLQSLSHARVSLWTSGNAPLQNHSTRLSKICTRLLEKHGVQLYPRRRVSGMDEAGPTTDSGVTEPANAIIWATPAKPTPFSFCAGLAPDADSFIPVHDTLQTIASATVFASGDCATLTSHPNLPKAGVFSVRQGPVLWDNLHASLHNKPLRPYRPQPLYLFLLNTSHDSAVMQYGRLALEGRWAMRWKDAIDRRWMHGLRDVYLK
ncbi:MAG: FAD-dependent oxidoreductase [Kiritimatiellae bacterium]|nr:FAD-dependent oxidoreductase [Kiritimatiellia bacterium]